MSVTAKALWYIESHMSDAPSVDDVATAVGVSPFHLSRAFRFESVLENDVQQLFTVLDRHPGIDRAGTLTSTDVGGFRVIRPWALMDSPAEVRSHDLHASDLCMLKAKDSR